LNTRDSSANADFVLTPEQAAGALLTEAEWVREITRAFIAAILAAYSEAGIAPEERAAGLMAAAPVLTDAIWALLQGRRRGEAAQPRH
jgi:hypothetical protein